MLGTVVCHLYHLHLSLTRCNTNAFHLVLEYFKATLIVARFSAGVRSFRSPIDVCCCRYSCVCPFGNLILPPFVILWSYLIIEHLEACSELPFSKKKNRKREMSFWGLVQLTSCCRLSTRSTVISVITKSFLSRQSSLFLAVTFQHRIIDCYNTPTGAPSGCVIRVGAP